MRLHAYSSLLTAFAIGAVGTNALAETPLEPFCGVTDDETTSQATTCLGTFDIDVVFFTFEDAIASHEDSLYPTWGDDMLDSFEEYLDTMSNGQHTVNVNVYRQASPDEDLRWVLPYESTEFSSNSALTAAVDAYLPSDWGDGADARIYYSDVRVGHQGQNFGRVCNVGSKSVVTYGSMNSSGDWSFAFGSEATGLFTDFVGTLTAHEYGHALGFGHFYDSYFSCFTPMHQYGGAGCTRSSIEQVDGYLPYHISNLIDVGFVTPTEITEDTEDIELRDLREAGQLLKVPIASGEYFLISNHQREGSDDVFNGRGLLVWHFDGSTIDLEQQLGKYEPDVSEPDCPAVPKVADPEEGVDELDCSHAMVSTAFYSGLSLMPWLPAKEFAPETNPNTNQYSGCCDRNSPQATSTGIAIRNVSSSADSLASGKYVLKFDILFE